MRLSFSPLWITAGMAIFCVEKHVGFGMSDDFSHHLGGFIVLFPDFKNIGEVHSDFFVSGVFEITVYLRKNSSFFEIFCKWWILLCSRGNRIWIVAPLGDYDAEVVPEVWPKTVSELLHRFSRLLIVPWLGTIQY